MQELLLNHQTQQDISGFIKEPSHALIIQGSVGSGKAAIATHLSSKLIDTDIDSLSSNKSILFITPENGSISINDIRKAREFTKLKTTGNSKIRRLLIIESAETMTKEAQNALLKLIEEPPEDTAIILTVSDLTNLLPTIISRCQILAVRPVEFKSTVDYFVSNGYHREQVEKAYHISQGLPGLMATILAGGSNELLEQINTAKELLTKSVFERLKEVDKIAKQKDQISKLFIALETVCAAGLKQSADKDKPTQVKKWHRSLSSVVEAQIELKSQANTKLVLDNLMLAL